MTLRFLSSSYAALATNTGFRASVQSLPMVFMANYCPGPVQVNVLHVAVMALTSASAYANNMSCSLLLYSGDPTLALRVNLFNFYTELNDDVLTAFDGPSAWAPQLCQLSGSVGSRQYVPRCVLPVFAVAALL